jgi:Asparagine synthase
MAVILSPPSSLERSCDQLAWDGRARLVTRSEGFDVEVGPCGGRAIFARRSGGVWHVSQALASLVALAPCRLNPRWLASLCMLEEWTDPTSTPYLDVLRLRPGGTSKLRNAEATPRFFPSAVPPACSSDDLEPLLRAHLARYARGPLAVLTGGIDSSLILALGAPKGVACVSIDLDGPEPDRGYVEMLCQHLGLTPTFVQPADCAGLLPADMTVDAAPLAWPSSPLEIGSMKIALSLGCVAAVSGGGGDDLFEREQGSAGAIFASGAWSAAVRIASAGTEGTVLTRLRKNLVWPLLRRQVPWPLRRLKRTLRDGRDHYPTFFRSLARKEHDEVRARRLRHRTVEECSPDERVAWAFDLPFSGPTAFHRHLSEVAAGIPRFDPYFEPDVIACAMSAPLPAHFEGTLPRGLLRRAARGRLPPAVWERTSKAGFEGACAAVFRAHRPALDALADVGALADLGVIEPRRFAEAYARFAGDPVADLVGWGTVWPTLAVEAFVRGVGGLPGRFTGRMPT